MHRGCMMHGRLVVASGAADLPTYVHRPPHTRTHAYTHTRRAESGAPPTGYPLPPQGVTRLVC